MNMALTLIGKREMQQRLNAMSAASSLGTLQPIVERRARTVQEMAQKLAPVKTGRLRSGIVLNFQKAGIGYCYFILTLTRLAYYGIFQELGLGAGRSSGKLSAKTQKARVRFAGRQAAYKAGQIKRLRRTGQGRNMAAQPFMRPAVQFSRQWFVGQVLSDIWDRISSEGAAK
jgi:hypothetical protein